VAWRANALNAAFAVLAAALLYLAACELLMRGEAPPAGDGSPQPQPGADTSSDPPVGSHDDDGRSSSGPKKSHAGPSSSSSPSSSQSSSSSPSSSSSRSHAALAALEAPPTATVAMCAAAAALLFALSPLAWTYATHLEVFALNNLLAAAALHRAGLLENALARLALLDGGAEPRARVVRVRTEVLGHACFGAFLCGLGLSHQHTLALLVVPLAAFTLARARAVLLAAKPAALLAASALAGSLPVLVFLPYLSSLRTPLGWGDCTTLAGLARHVLRGDYGTLSLAPGGSELVAMSSYSGWFAARTYLESLVSSEFGWCGAAVTALGAAVATTSRRFRPLGPGVAFLLVIYVSIFSGLQNIPLNSKLHAGVVARFYMQPNLLMALLAAVGFRCLALLVTGRAQQRARRGGGGNDDRTENSVVLGALFAVLILAHAAPTLPVRHAAQRHSLAVRDYARAILRPLPRDALLLTKGDLNINAIRYVQRAEAFRADVVLFDLAIGTYEWHVADPRVRIPGKRTKKGGRSARRRGVLGRDYGLRELLEYNVLANVATNGTGAGYINRRAFVVGGVRPHWSLERMLEDESLARLPAADRRGMWESFPYGFTDYIFHVPEGIVARHELSVVDFFWGGLQLLFFLKNQKNLIFKPKKKKKNAASRR
jgi:hypothetical protein